LRAPQRGLIATTFSKSRARSRLRARARQRPSVYTKIVSLEGFTPTTVLADVDVDVYVLVHVDGFVKYPKGLGHWPARFFPSAFS